jgi:CRISPR/Cas system-associated exonuclease Cas4 (RecB family)
LIVEDGFSVPVERKPLAKKLRDRYVAQILVYMRLVEEFEGQKPPYGYLLLGPQCRRVKIQNSPERQAWLDTLLIEMRAVLEGGEAKAITHPAKCSKCDVRHRCFAWVGDEQHTVMPKVSSDDE